MECIGVEKLCCPICTVILNLLVKHHKIDIYFTGTHNCFYPAIINYQLPKHDSINVTILKEFKEWISKDHHSLNTDINYCYLRTIDKENENKNEKIPKNSNQSDDISYFLNKDFKDFIFLDESFKSFLENETVKKLIEIYKKF